MYIKYEIACEEAGLSAEQIQEIRRFLDGERVKKFRDKEKREKEGIVFNSISALAGAAEDEKEFEIPDVDADPAEVLIHAEEKLLHDLNLKKLQGCLAEMAEEDRWLLLTYYAGGYGIESKLARELGISRSALQRRRKKLLSQLQEKFFD